MADKRLTVHFVGGSKVDFVLPNAETVASNFRSNEWVEIKNHEINTRNIAYYVINDIPVPPKVN